MYNEMVIIKMVQSSTKLLQQPPELFRQEICEHWNQRGLSMYERINGWMELSKATTNNQNEEATAKTVSENMHQPKQTNTNEGRQKRLFKLISVDKSFTTWHFSQR